MAEIHYIESYNENGTLCNTKSPSTPTENQKEVTCQKCKQYLRSQELSNFRSRHLREIEKKNVLDKIYSKKARFTPTKRHRYRNADD